MPSDWMTDRVHAGHDLAERLLKGENPIFSAVELGSAVGLLAAKLFAARGPSDAQKFLVAFTAVFSQEARAADPDQEILHLRSE